MANRDETLKYGFKAFSRASIPKERPSIKMTWTILFSFMYRMAKTIKKPTPMPKMTPETIEMGICPTLQASKVDVATRFLNE